MSKFFFDAGLWHAHCSRIRLLVKICVVIDVVTAEIRDSCSGCIIPDVCIWIRIERPSFCSVYRPFSEDELKSNAPQVISCYEHRREVTVCQNIATKQIDRTFTFDKVRKLFLLWRFTFHVHRSWMQHPEEYPPFTILRLVIVLHLLHSSLRWVRDISVKASFVLSDSGSCCVPGLRSYVSAKGSLWPGSYSHRARSAWWVQLYHICIWSDWDRKDLHNGRFREEGEGRSFYPFSLWHRRLFAIALKSFIVKESDLKPTEGDQSSDLRFGYQLSSWIVVSVPLAKMIPDDGQIIACPEWRAASGCWCHS